MLVSILVAALVDWNHPCVHACLFSLDRARGCVRASYGSFVAVCACIRDVSDPPGWFCFRASVPSMFVALLMAILVPVLFSILMSVHCFKRWSVFSFRVVNVASYSTRVPSVLHI